MLLAHAMIFMHIIGDYALQSVCNFHNMKQESWWKKVYDIDILKESKIKNDYKVILYLHGFSWSICILLPIIVDYYFKYNHFDYIFQWFITFVIFINTIIHSVVDDMKANMNVINLVDDQAIHFIQMSITLLLYVTFFR